MLSHSSPLSKNNYPVDSDKSPVGTKTTQLTAKIDNSLSNAQNIEEILKRNQYASTSVSVTSKNITTANYLNQNNQYITSQPIPSHNTFGTLVNATSPQKTTLEELEKKLLELEKATQDPKSIFSQNPLLSSPETLNPSDQNQYLHRVGNSPQMVPGAFKQIGQIERGENSEKKKKSSAQARRLENPEINDFQRDNNDLGHAETSPSTMNKYTSSVPRSKTAYSNQVLSQEEGSNEIKQPDIQNGIISREGFSSNISNESKNSLKHPISTQKGQRQYNPSELLEFQEDSDLSAAKAQNRMKGSQQQRNHDTGNDLGNSYTKTNNLSSPQTQNDPEHVSTNKRGDQVRDLRQEKQAHHPNFGSDEELSNDNMNNSPHLEKKQASFGNDPSHYETQVQATDFQSIVPPRNLEGSKAQKDNITASSSQHFDLQKDSNPLNPFSAQPESRKLNLSDTSKQSGQNRSENQQFEDFELENKKAKQSWQNQAVSGTHAPEISRLKQDVSEFLVTKQTGPDGKVESEVDKDNFQKSFENNLSVDPKRRSDFGADRDIESTENENQYKYSTPATENSKKQIAKGRSKNLGTSPEEIGPQYNQQSNIINQNVGSSTQSKTKDQYNPTDLEANTQTLSQRESHGNASNTKAGNRSNIDKSATSEISRNKGTPNKSDTSSRLNRKTDQTSPSQKTNTEESQGLSAAKGQRGLSYEKSNNYSNKKTTAGQNDEEPLYEDLFRGTSSSNKQQRLNSRPSEKDSAQRIESNEDVHTEKRLSRMDEDQAASLYEQRKNDIQKNMQKMSKNRIKNNTKKQEKKPTVMMQSTQSPGLVSDANKLQKQQKQNVSKQETNEYAQGREEETDLGRPYSTDLSGTKRKALIKGNVASVTNTQNAQLKDSRASLEKASKQNMKQEQSNRQGDTKSENVNKFGDAIQNARDNIFQRMENIERALNKDEPSSSRSDKRTSFPTYKEKAKSRPRDIDPQSIDHNRTPVNSSDKLRSPVTAKTEISTATSPHDPYSLLSSNKQGYSTLKAQGKSSQKEKGISKVETGEIPNESMRPGNYGGASGSKKLQNYSKEETSFTGLDKSLKPSNPSYNSNDVVNKESKIKKAPFQTNSTDHNRVDLRTPSKREENSKLYTSENKTRATINNEPSNIQRDFSGSKQLLRGSEGPKISYSEIPSHSKYHEKRLKGQAEKEESTLNRLEPARNLEESHAYSREVPSHSKYHEKRQKAQKEKEELAANQSMQSGTKVRQQQTKEKLTAQEGSEKKLQNRYNQNLASLKSETVQKRKEVSFSPKHANQSIKPTSDELSFEERNRLWVIKKNQNLAEKERMKYSQESTDCTFHPLVHQNDNLRKLSSNEFYQRNIEWSEKIKADNVLKGEQKMEEQQKRESKPKVKSNPTSPINPIRTFGIFANKDLETVKKNLDFSGHQANKKLKTYFEYEWKDDRLRQEIDDIEELYNYVKSLVKSRLDPNSPSKSFSAEKTNSQTNIQKQNASPYSYKHKNPLGRASLSAEKEIPRMQSLRNFVGLPKESSIASERASITKKPELEGSIHREPSFQALMDKEKSTRLVIKDNRYVIADDDAPENN